MCAAPLAIDVGPPAARALLRPLCPSSLAQGTVSNVHQDVTTTRGRMFAATLFISGMLLLVSRYTFYLYRPWAAAGLLDTNPMQVPMLVPPLEKAFRAVWCVLPAVGFMLTAVIPSVSAAKGYEDVLTGVHNVSAPISALLMLIMETVQLTTGEHAFGFVLSQGHATSVYGPLTSLQRLRVLVVCMAWLAVAVFFPTQGYIMVYRAPLAAKFPGRFPIQSFPVALLSYGGEYFAMLLTALLPALAGVDMITLAFAPGPEMPHATGASLIMLDRSGGAWYAW